MFNNTRKDLTLIGRNEGKIKSYESCLDIRAWSHDIHVRDRYLRDWIKSDMPVCVVPVCTVASFLSTMTWRRSRKVAPRCHPNCKSKVVLDSICNSCNSIKECLKNEEAFDKYFVEEEFETTHWPCERCLEALKSIKMFWKIILEKIFHLNVSHNASNSTCSSNESIKTITRAWQSEIIEETLIVKSLSPLLINPSENSWHYRVNDITLDERKTLFKDTGTEIDKCHLTHKRSTKCLQRKLSKCTIARVKTINVGCNTCDCNVGLKESYYIDSLQKQPSDELKRLKKENASLRLELQNIYNGYCIPKYSPLIVPDTNNVVAPMPYESCSDNEIIKDIDSEMIITLKNCKNKNFRHVSMFQVLHKTNTLIADNGTSRGNNGRKNEDPIEILRKVQNTFEDIIERELKIANKKKPCRRDTSVSASYQEPPRNTKKPYVPCPNPVKSSHSSIPNSIFLSATEVS